MVFLLLIAPTCTSNMVQIATYVEMFLEKNFRVKRLKCILLFLIRLPGDQWLTQEFCSGGSTNSAEDRGQRERGSGGGSPLVRGSGGSCNLVQEISFHIVIFS